MLKPDPKVTAAGRLSDLRVVQRLRKAQTALTMVRKKAKNYEETKMKEIVQKESRRKNSKRAQKRKEKQEGAAAAAATTLNATAAAAEATTAAASNVIDRTRAGTHSTSAAGPLPLDAGLQKELDARPQKICLRKKLDEAAAPSTTLAQETPPQGDNVTHTKEEVWQMRNLQRLAVLTERLNKRMP